jgi:hypothetical protein
LLHSYQPQKSRSLTGFKTPHLFLFLSLVFTHRNAPSRGGCRVKQKKGGDARHCCRAASHRLLQSNIVATTWACNVPATRVVVLQAVNVAMSSLQCYHCSNAEVTTLQRHHCNNSAKAPSLQQQCRNAIVAKATLQSHRCNDSVVMSSLQR